MKPTTDKTLQWGCLISADQPMLVEHPDFLKDSGESISVVSRYEVGRQGNPWVGWTYDDKLVTSCELLSTCIANADDLRCILSEEGFVRIYGPGGNPDASFQIPDAGVHRKGAKGYGYVHRIRAIGADLYVCGDSRQVYRFMAPAGTGDAAAWLKRGRFVHMDAGMLQPPMPEHPGPKASKQQQDQWLEATDSCPFWDIHGSSESDIYAVGDQSWHWNGQLWQQLSLPNDGETVHVVKVIDADNVIMAGANGYVLVGNAREGFANISTVDDNQTFSGIEYFDDKLWLASNAGLFTFDRESRRIEKYVTPLEPDLQDTHLLEAKDGVLWSFGYKDLAYLDGRNGKHEWVRVHHPDNPRIGSRTARPAKKHADLDAAEPAEVAQSTAAALRWLPTRPESPGTLDIGGLISRVGHGGVGAFVCAQLAAFGLRPNEVLQVSRSARYQLAVPGQGIAITLQYTGPKRAAANPEDHPEHWALAEVAMLGNTANGAPKWLGPWPGDLNPDDPDLLRKARKLWGGEGAKQGNQASFFVDGTLGAAWVINFEWIESGPGLKQLRVLHLGNYLDPAAKRG